MSPFPTLNLSGAESVRMMVGHLTRSPSLSQTFVPRISCWALKKQDES